MAQPYSKADRLAPLAHLLAAQLGQPGQAPPGTEALIIPHTEDQATIDFRLFIIRN